jgi:hypothetical protein
MEPREFDMSPETPSSPLARSLDLSSSTFDELRNALSEVNSASTETDTVVRCCCGREDCHNTVSWLAVRAKLEHRIFLTAGVPPSQADTKGALTGLQRLDKPF